MQPLQFFNVHRLPLLNFQVSQILIDHLFFLQLLFQGVLQLIKMLLTRDNQLLVEDEFLLGPIQLPSHFFDPFIDLFSLSFSLFHVHFIRPCRLSIHEIEYVFVSHPGILKVNSLVFIIAD